MKSDDARWRAEPSSRCHVCVRLCVRDGRPGNPAGRHSRDMVAKKVRGPVHRIEASSVSSALQGKGAESDLLEID